MSPNMESLPEALKAGLYSSFSSLTSSTVHVGLVGGSMPSFLARKLTSSPIICSRTMSLRSALTWASSNSKFSQWCSCSTVSAYNTCDNRLSRVSWKSSSLNCFCFLADFTGTVNMNSLLGKMPQKADDQRNTSCFTIWKSLSVSTELMSTFV